MSAIVDSETMLTLDKAGSDAWQAGIATSLWQAMVTRPLPAEGFGSAVSRATAERHLQVYSADPAEEALLDRLGASGRMEVPENPLAVSWSGFVGSRTGYFAEKAIDYSAVVNENGTADVTITLTLTNEAPRSREHPAGDRGARLRRGRLRGRGDRVPARGGETDPQPRRLPRRADRA